MKYQKKFQKRKPRERQMNGLKVEVYNNNIDMALRKLKRKIKDSNIMFELKEKAYFIKPSKIKREKKNLAMARQRYENFKEKEKN